MAATQFHSFAFHDTGFVHAISTVTNRDSTTGIPTDGKCLQVRHGESTGRKLFGDAVIRRILVEMHDVFTQCQLRVKLEGKLDNDTTLDFSRMYRSILRSNADVDAPDDPHMRDFALWGIYETMFLQKGDSPIAVDLIKWAHDSFIFAHQTAKQAAEEYEQGMPVSQGNYWKAVAVTLISWRLDACVDFLRYMRNDTAAQLFIEHLEKFDIEWLLDQNKSSKFADWQALLKKIIATKQLHSNMNINVLARLLAGDEVILAKMAECTLTDWWHLMPFYVLVRHPTVPYNCLGPIAEECRALFKDQSNQDDYDPFFAVFNLGDVSILQNLVANPWLSLHLVDTMYCCESYDQPIQKVRATLLENYGSNIFVNSDLWEVGASYLLECGAEGKLRLEGLITAMLIEDEATAEKVHKLCLDNELEEARCCVINTMTNAHLRSGAWAAALSWALRGGHSKTLDTAVNTIVRRATEEEITEMLMMEHLGELVLLSQSLSFLYNYYLYFTRLHEGDGNKACQILMGLVTSPDVPSSFHSKLFTQLCGILQCKEITMTKDSVYDLLSFFKQHSIDRVDEEECDLLPTMKQLLLIRLRDAIVG